MIEFSNSEIIGMAVSFCIGLLIATVVYEIQMAHDKKQRLIRMAKMIDIPTDPIPVAVSIKRISKPKKPTKATIAAMKRLKAGVEKAAKKNCRVANPRR